MGNEETPLLEVENLQTYIPVPKGVIRPVNDVSFSIGRGEIVALVGESGSGKSVSALSVMGLNASAIKYEKESKIYFKGKNLIEMKKRDLKKVRGNEISMVFQDPMFSLNPVHPIGKQIAEVIMLHQKTKYKEVQNIVLDLLTKVGIPDAKRRLNDYPHQLSGGMRQRVMIAISLACDPELIIADEPTTALDVTIQAQILNLLKKMREENDISILLITHDLGVVAEVADRVLVMYCGKVVEEGKVEDIFENPRHPYTKGLISCVPKLDGPSEEQLDAIPGIVPNPLELPRGCNFVTRCAYATEKCQLSEPMLKGRGDSESQVACWNSLPKKGDSEHNAETFSFS